MLKRPITILALTSLFLFGCGKDDPTSPTTTQTNTSATGGQPMPSFSGSGVWGGTLGTIAFDFSDPNFPLPIPISMTIGYAQFGTLNGGQATGVDAGSVSVNDHDLPKTTSGSIVAYSSFSGTSSTTLSDLQFDGTSTHSWTVSGSSNVPAMNLSVVAPSNFTLTAPASGAVISKSSGIDLNWTGGNSESDSMMVTISPTASGTSFSYIQQGIHDNGSFTIPASALGSVSGECILHVLRYRYSAKSSGGKDYYAVAEVVKQITITVQ
jgi:hypothetical protein